MVGPWFIRRSALVVLLVSSCVATAVAQTPPADSVRLCVQKDSFAVRLIPRDQSCRDTENLIVLNTQGPPGPPGPGLDTGGVIGRLTAECFTVGGAETFLRGHSFLARTDTDRRFELHWVPAG